MIQKKKPVKGANSVFLNKELCEERRIELGLTQNEVGERCGRTGAWYTGLHVNKTTPQAAKLLADVLGFDYEDILVKPEEPKQTEMIIPVRPEGYGADLAEAVRMNTAELEKITAALKSLANHIQYIGTICDDLPGVLQHLEQTISEQGKADVNDKNVKEAESVLGSMTADTGECAAKKFADACESRRISEAERVRAMDNLGAMYQWRTSSGGTRKCYVVRGC